MFAGECSMTNKLKITILTDKSSWMTKYSMALTETLKSFGHHVTFINSKNELSKGDVAFFLSCFEIIPQKYLSMNKNNIVVHESNLPQGKGWSPMTWQILEGKNDIPVTLFEANKDIDAGDIYMQDVIRLYGNELVEDWREKLGRKTCEMCIQFINNYFSVPHSQKQYGNSSFYQKRMPKDSELDPNKSIMEQFNLLRVVDNEKYPAFFILKNRKYILKIYTDNI
jgi:methionyl-tRNA formyltransferase